MWVLLKGKHFRVETFCFVALPTGKGAWGPVVDTTYGAGFTLYGTLGTYGIFAVLSCQMYCRWRPKKGFHKKEGLPNKREVPGTVAFGHMVNPALTIYEGISFGQGKNYTSPQIVFLAEKLSFLPKIRAFKKNKSNKRLTQFKKMISFRYSNCTSYSFFWGGGTGGKVICWEISQEQGIGIKIKIPATTWLYTMATLHSTGRILLCFYSNSTASPSTAKLTLAGV